MLQQRLRGWDKTKDVSGADLTIRPAAFRERYNKLLYEDQWVELVEYVEAGDAS